MVSTFLLSYLLTQAQRWLGALAQEGA